MNKYETVLKENLNKISKYLNFNIEPYFLGNKALKLEDFKSESGNYIEYQDEYGSYCNDKIIDILNDEENIIVDICGERAEVCYMDEVSDVIKSEYDDDGSDEYNQIYAKADFVCGTCAALLYKNLNTLVKNFPDFDEDGYLKDLSLEDIFVCLFYSYFNFICDKIFPNDTEKYFDVSSKLQ